MERVPRSISERRVFVDTSAFLALIDRSDQFHARAHQVLTRLEHGRYRLLSSSFVIVETHAGLLAAVGVDRALSFVEETMRGAVAVMHPEPSDEERAVAILRTHRDKTYSLCDALSFALIERLGVRLAFSCDDHFKQHGLSTPLERPEWP